MDTTTTSKTAKQNPFKGVKGGDPSRRPVMVEVSYTCPSCGKDTQRMIAEGKPTPSTPCQQCQDAVNAQRSKTHAEEVIRRHRARQAVIDALPTRSDEEFEALSARLAELPHMQCSSCALHFPVGVQGAAYLNDDPYEENSVQFVQFVKNPFKLEVYGESDWQWMCNKCRYNSQMDV